MGDLRRLPQRRLKPPKKETRAWRNIRWIETYCHVPEGKDVGMPLLLRDWQRRLLIKIYDNPYRTRRAILSFGRKNAKGLALDTPIPSPRGWTTMGRIKAGDKIYGSDGRPTLVEYVSPVHLNLKCWRVTFSDGSSIVADEEHRWLTRHSYRPWAEPRVTGSGNGGRCRTDVVTTPQIAASVRRPNRAGRVEYNHKIALAPALASDDAALPIDPYVLGAWLGDGTSSAATFTCADRDLEDIAEQLSTGLGGAVRIRSNVGGRASTICTPGLGFHVALRSLGVLNDKHVPDAYLEAGTAQRWALLQGLMDTDGTVNQHAGRTTPRASFSGTNERLCRGVWRLARSLGLKATIRSGDAKLYGRTVSRAFAVSFSASKAEPVFRLQRKQDALPETIKARSRSLSIVACEPVDSVPTVCLKVAAADSLFLAGEGCVPTHNTSIAACLLLLHTCGPEAVRNGQLYSTAQTRDQAAVLFELAAKMVRMSVDLDLVCGIRDTNKQIHCPELGTTYTALSADAKSKHGKSPSFIVHDELGQVLGPRSPLYEALETATSANMNPLSIIISTQAPTDADLLSTLIDDAETGADPRTVLEIYTAPLDLDPFSDMAIMAANPAYGDFQNPVEIRDMAEAARRMPQRESEYRNLILNQRVEVRQPFISRDAWRACGAEPLEDFAGLPVFAGLDLAEVHDLAAFVPMAPVDGGLHWDVRPTFWLPADGLREKSRLDRVPFDLWTEQGFIEAVPGPVIDFAFIAQFLYEFCRDNDVRRIAFDDWGWKHLRPLLLRAGFRESQLEGDHAIFETMRQGTKSMSPALNALEALLLTEKVRHGNHPVLEMCARNAVVGYDEQKNRKLVKSKSAGRIDGMVALAMAAAVAGTWQAPPIFDIKTMIV